MAVSIVTAGIQGPPGPAGNGYTYEHIQTTPLMIWSINHNMRKYPAVFLTDLQGTPIRGLLVHVDDVELTVTFSAPVAGIARLN
jgi:hypothetical protein